MRINRYFDNITLFPFSRELENYGVPTLFRDLMAGLSVALLTMPQAMAYALIAGLPLSAGFFSAIFSSFIASLFGSSRYLILGPSNAIAILIQYAIAEILYAHYRHLTGAERDQMAIQILTQLSVLVASFQLLATSFGLGRLTQFVSQPVITAYISGCAVAIIVSQFNVILGIPASGEVLSLFEQGAYALTHLKFFNPMTLIVGLGSLFALIAFKKWDKRIPAAALTFVIASIVIYFIQAAKPGSVREVLVIGDVGDLADMQASYFIPYFDLTLMNELLPVAFAVSLFSILETSSVSKTVAASTGEPCSISQDILALGMGNLISSFVGAMPISGSTSRTILNIASGAQTRCAAMFAAVFVGIALYIFGDFVMHIPLAALSALLLVTAFSIVNKKQLMLCLKATRADAYVFWITFLSCIFFSIDIAFYIGVCLSIISYLSKAAVPQVTQYVIDKSGKLKKLELSAPEEMGNVRFIKVKGELFFGAVDLFQTTLKSVAEDDAGTRVIILHLKNARDIDATACLAIQQLYEYLNSSKRYLLITGLTLPIWEVLSDSGIVSQIGKENLFLIDDRQPVLYMELAMKRAQELAGTPAIRPQDLAIPASEDLGVAFQKETSLKNSV
jgi:SulP family sulfate permease